MLFSDGIHNAAGDPVAAARKLGVVVHAVGVGNSLRNSPSYRDVRVADLACPEQLPVGNRAKITAHIGQAGLSGQVVKAVLEEDGKTIDQAEVVLRDGGTPQEVSFQFVPTVKGRHTLRGDGFRPCSRSGSSRTTSGRPWSRWSIARSGCSTSRGPCGPSTGRWCRGSSPRTPTSNSVPWSRSRPNVFVRRTNMEGLKLAGLPADAAAFEGST